MKNNAKLVGVLIVLVGCFLFFSCASTMPISDGIIREIGGVDNADQFQYYVSKTITLTLVDSQTSANIEGGQLRRTSSTARDTIIIRANLPGVVRNHWDGSDDALSPKLGVAFEEYEGDFPTLAFGKYRVGSQEKYFLLYRDPKNDIVAYGDRRYKVSFDNKKPHEGQPYLLIKGSQSAKSSSTARKASGLKL